ncbi:MAG: hypothetical protein KGJ24_00950 [Burkholderiales bacterium]|nr:hypothetical protein [Burkholderiales bacterium]
MARRLRFGIWLLGLGWAAAAAAQSALLTIVDGSAVLIEGARRLAAAPGLAVGPGTLVETGPKLNLLRIEWPDGTVADLGPQTSLMLAPPVLGRGEPRAAYYLLRGWAKQGSLGAVATTGFVTPALQVAGFKGSVLAHVADAPSPGAAGAAGSFVYAESGQAAVLDRAAPGHGPASLANGAVYVAEAAGKALKWRVAARLTPEQMQSVPPGLRDSLPLQAARLAGRKVVPQVLAPPGYDELQPWLDAERGLRRGFPDRFAVLAREPAFRARLDADLRAHPEWTGLLHPERLARPASAPAVRAR